MEIYINKSLISRIHVYEKEIIKWAKFKKARPEKRVFFGLIVYQIATQDGWRDTFSIRQLPLSLDEFRKINGQKYSLDDDGMTIILRPRVVIKFVNGDTETKYFETYNEASSQAIFIASQNTDLIKFE